MTAKSIKEYLKTIAIRKDPVNWESDEDPVDDSVVGMEAYVRGFQDGVGHAEIALAGKLLQRFFGD